MVDKILSIFFDKKVENKKNLPTIIKRTNNSKQSGEKQEKTRNETITCLSGYFIGHRGLNLIERGYSYKTLINARNQR